MAEDTETPEEVEEYELTDAENEQALMFPVATLGGQIKGLIAANGTDELTWKNLEAESKRIVYIFDALSGLRFYLRAQVINNYLHITTEMG